MRSDRTHQKVASLLIVGLFSVIGGCQSLGRVLYRPGESTKRAPASRVLFAVDFGDVQQLPAKSESTAAQLSKEVEESASDSPAKNKSETEAKKPDTVSPAPGESVRVGYTTPTAAVVLAAIGTTTQPTIGGANDPARAASESASIPSRQGVATSRATVSGVIVSRPGLQEGLARGLGFASPNNIFTRQSNPLSGPAGRCQDLANAGFFSGNRATCENHFQPRR